MFKKSCQILVYKGEKNFHEKHFDNLATPCGAPWVIAEPPRARRGERRAPYLIENGELSVTLSPYGLSGKGWVETNSPLSPREFCPILFQKALAMIDKTESIYWANVWVDFSGRYFDFWGGYGWFKKKYPVCWFRAGKACKVTLGEMTSCNEKNFAHDVYNAEKKS